jgi:hypothetical protein
MTALDDVKAALRVTHDDDDALLTRLIGSALRECLAFMDAGNLPVVPGAAADVDIPEDVFQAVVLMVQADYDGSPEKRTAYRAAAEQLLWPYRSF